MSEKYIMHTTSLFKIDDTFNDDRFMRVRVAALHSGINLNNSRINTSAIQKAKSSFANIPILANIIVYTDKDGNQHLDYGGHDMHIEDDLFNDGEQRMIYDEKVVGVVPEKNNFEIVHDNETDNDYAYVDALIYREYGNYCADILESRGGKTSISSELWCDTISYDSKEKCLDINEFTMTGITLLGENVKPAMKKASATVFSIDQENRQEQLLRIMQELTLALNNYTQTINNSTLGKEEEQIVNKEKFEELLKKYNVTESDVTFEYAELDDIALEAKFEEIFGKDDGNEPPTENDDNHDDDSKDDDNSDDNDSDDNDDSNDDNQTELNSLQLSMIYGENKVEFATSLSDQLYALTELVNSQYSVDETWYYVDAYTEPSKYVVMQDIFTGRAYKQDYKIRKDEYQLVGDRVEVFAQFLTADEVSKLDDMRKNYSVIENKLSLYESEPEKVELLQSEEFAAITETDEYKELVKRENYFELSKEDIENKLNSIVLTYAKKGMNFSVKKDDTDADDKKPVKKTFSFFPVVSARSGNSKKKNYGGLLG